MDIVREFNVNETWLRTGEGPMFRPLGRDQELYTFIGNIALGPDSFKRRFIEALAKMPEEQWDALYRLAKTLVDAVEEQPPPGGRRRAIKKAPASRRFRNAEPVSGI